MIKDPIGDRMKKNYEDVTRYKLPRRTNTIIRLDGKAFHTFTRGLERPFDQRFCYIMQLTAAALCEEVQGCQFAYTQSDEISLLLTDYANIDTCAWFDGNLQKIASISASIATYYFNLYYQADRRGPAFFDSRAFTIPDSEEVANYFVWRQQDATRNSINMVAQSLYSHRELQGKSSKELQELIHQKGQNWNDYPAKQKRGAAVRYVDTKWVVEAPPIFTQDRDYILNTFL
jgi:tRNA(His) guanylyltransferase